MKTLERLVVITLLGFAPIAGAQINMPNLAQPGSSPENAVRLVSTSDLMVDRQISRWLKTHYPGWDADPHEFMELGEERYAVVFITSKDNPGRRVFFRVLKHQNEEDSGFPQR